MVSCARPTRHTGTEGMAPASLLCSPSAHAGMIKFYVKGGAPSTGAVGATRVPFPREGTSKLGGIIYSARTFETNRATLRR
jgi:hypothetical protein